MSKQLILAITGSAGAGKSTVAGKLAKQIHNCVNIDVDHVKHFIVNGFIYGSEPSGVKQWALLGKNIGQVAANFKNEGYNVIINGFLYEPAWNELNRFATFTHKVILLPSIEALHIRDSMRSEDKVLGKEKVKDHFDYFSINSFYNDFTKLDTTTQTADETTEIIKKLLAIKYQA